MKSNVQKQKQKMSCEGEKEQKAQSKEVEKEISSKENQEKFILQYAVFKRSLDMRLREYLIDRQRRNQLSYKIWWISDRYMPHNWTRAFEYMQQASCITLHLDRTQNSRILNQIAFPQFSLLKQLYLSDNGITNIQALSFIDMPLVSWLILSRNKITNVSALSKLVLNNLSMLDLSSNLFSQIQKIGRLCSRINSMDLILLSSRSLLFRPGRYQFEQLQTGTLQTINALAKFENFIRHFDWNQFYDSDKNRTIPQLKALKTLEKKFTYDY